MTLNTLSAYRLLHPTRVLATMIIALFVFCSGCKVLTKKEAACDACPVCADEVEQAPLADDDQIETLAVQSAGYPHPMHAASPLPILGQVDPVMGQLQPNSVAMPIPEFGLGTNPISTTNPPYITGTYLDTPQIPASERALRFQEENQHLQLSQNTLLVDNQRLKKQVANTESLLGQTSAAMEGAQLALEQAEIANRELKQQIADVKRQQQRDQLNANRMLQSIRDELDDVLMREIALKQE